MVYITRNQIIAINANITGAHGHSIINAGALDEAINAPARVIMGHEMNKLLGEKAAALVMPIAQAHPFQDGNKRTAAQALVQFLAINGYTIIQGRENFVNDLIGRCADALPITKEDLAARLQMQIIKIGATFVNI